LLEVVSPPIDAFEMDAEPPSPPLPPLPSPVASPPTETAPAPAAESAFPLPLLETPDRLAATPSESSLVLFVAVDIELGEDAPPAADDVAVLEAAPPAPAVFMLAFEPEPPAPPATLTETELIAELDCVSVLVLVLVLLPEFVPDDEFAWLVLPCVTSSPNAVAANARANTATPARKVVCNLLTESLLSRPPS
jgi:hypothetical protein